MQASEAARATPVGGVAAVAGDVRTPYAHPCGCVAMVDRLAMYATVESVCCVRGLASGATCTYAVRTRGSECCCWGGARTRCVQCGCLLLGVCETFQRVSQRGYTSPFVLQGPNLGNLVACVLLMNNATMPSFIHSYITCQTSVTNIPARAAAGRRGQNVRYIPAVWQRPTSGHVRPPSKHVPSFHLVLSFRKRPWLRGRSIPTTDVTSVPRPTNMALYIVLRDFPM